MGVLVKEPRNISDSNNGLTEAPSAASDEPADLGFAAGGGVLGVLVSQ